MHHIKSRHHCHNRRSNVVLATYSLGTHMSLWAILAAPLLAGNDLRRITPTILAILTNREVIAVDQDKDGKARPARLEVR